MVCLGVGSINSPCFVNTARCVLWLLFTGLFSPALLWASSAALDVLKGDPDLLQSGSGELVLASDTGTKCTAWMEDGNPQMIDISFTDGGQLTGFVESLIAGRMVVDGELKREGRTETGQFSLDWSAESGQIHSSLIPVASKPGAPAPVESRRQTNRCRISINPFSLQVVEGACRKGLLHGPGQVTSSDRRRSYRGAFNRGALIYGEMRSPAGQYVGGLSGFQPQGVGRFTYSDGSAYQGQFVGGKPHGQGLCINAQGALSACDFVYGTLADKLTNDVPVAAISGNLAHGDPNALRRFNRDIQASGSELEEEFGDVQEDADRDRRNMAARANRVIAQTAQARQQREAYLAQRRATIAEMQRAQQARMRQQNAPPPSAAPPAVRSSGRQQLSAPTPASPTPRKAMPSKEFVRVPDATGLRQCWQRCAGERYVMLSPNQKDAICPKAISYRGTDLASRCKEFSRDRVRQDSVVAAAPVATAPAPARDKLAELPAPDAPNSAVYAKSCGRSLSDGDVANCCIADKGVRGSGFGEFASLENQCPFRIWVNYKVSSVSSDGTKNSKDVGLQFKIGNGRRTSNLDTAGSLDEITEYSYAACKSEDWTNDWVSCSVTDAVFVRRQVH